MYSCYESMTLKTKHAISNFKPREETVTANTSA